jgi:hypothetical protein
MDQLFGLGNMFAIVGWLLLIAAPRWRWTERLVLSGLWSVMLAVVYTALIALYMPQAEGGFSSIAEVRQLFVSDAILTAGWVHYLAFDLYVGAMLIRQAHADKLPHLAMIPILIATFLLGPIGLLTFFVVKTIRQRKLAEVTK